MNVCPARGHGGRGVMASTFDCDSNGDGFNSLRSHNVINQQE